MPILRTILLTLVLLAAAATSANAATLQINVGAGGDERMTPAAVTATEGDTVVFSWADSEHDLVLAGPESTRVGEQNQGFKLTRTFTRPGYYTFLCTLHDDMSGQLTITDDPAVEVPSAPPPVDVVVGPMGRLVLDPPNVTVVRGQTVNWQWGRGAIGVVFADGPSSGPQPIGSHWSRTFDTAATFPYSTGVGHGTVTVTEPGAPSASGIGAPPAGAVAAADITVGSPGNSFSPSTVTLDEGQTVRWTWAAGPHNVHFADGTDSGFKSAGIDEKAFYTPGTFAFVCTAHSGMSGTVQVTDTGAPGPNETAPDPPPVDPPAVDPPPVDPGTVPVLDIGVGGLLDLFSVTDVTVQTGQSVSWTWTGGVHNVSFTDGPGSGIRSTGTWSRRFLGPGEYLYVCQLHAGMQGRVLAVGAPVTGTPESATPPADPPAAAPSPGVVPVAAVPVALPAAGNATRAPATRPAADTTGPAFKVVRGTVGRSRGSHSLRVTLSEDARLDVAMSTVGSSGDLVSKRSFKVYARKGTRTVRLPAMNLTAKRYRLRIVAVDQAGNRSAAQTVSLGRR